LKNSTLPAERSTVARAAMAVAARARAQVVVRTVTTPVAAMVLA